ncbi:phage terminase large subunit-like protein [Ancylobacter sp. 3268]|uniref:terminase large subunit n=1 Tax=Ancylobacter sp. 3268 TaxID=2817752 RepID=UPI00285D19A9|nr:terminase TerL endonuclease subunit [Ancylobacter sp. 3268]MDR6953797.1 phage terminase large subunit-like protein [Ancylobacter sp. 3268]
MPKKPRARRTATSVRSNDPTTDWARDVLAGRIVAGELVGGAAERHLRDLRDGEKRGLIWRPDKAAHALGFFPAMLSVTAGTAAGKPFHPLPWHVFCGGSIFGWRKASGRMRFRSAWLETGKGQAKSPFMAAIGLYLMGWYGVPRAEVFAIGQDKNTANVLFKDAVAMCRAPIPPGEDEDDTLENQEEGGVVIRGEGDNAWKIEHPATGSKFLSLANGEAISGPRPIAVLADEIHEFKRNTSIEIWKNAIGKMPGDAIMILGTNTPSTNQIVGTEYSEFYQKVARGEFRDDEAFAFIARVDKADRETVFDNPDCWPKSLPALGVTFPRENIEGMVATAKQLLSTAMSVKRLYFGIPIGATDFWIAEDAWQEVQGVVDVPALRRYRCWLALDLSDKNDFTALTAVWIDDDGLLFAKTWYWTRKRGLADRAREDQAPYEEWVEAEFLTAVDAPIIDKTFVAAEVRRLCAEHDVQFLAFDAAKMEDFEQACLDIGFPVWRWKGPNKPRGRGLMLVQHAQGKRVMFEDKQLCMPRSVERLEDRILSGTIVIEQSPVTTSCAANAQLDSDGQNNRAFDKARSRGRIDGLVTIAMAVGAADTELKLPGKSFADSEDAVDRLLADDAE